MVIEEDETVCDCGKTGGKMINFLWEKNVA